MAHVKIDKVVSSLPVILDPNTVYGVRVGRGFDIYITDSTASIAHPLNHRQNIYGSGSVYGYSNDRWVTDSDDFHGTSEFRYREGAGTGANPTIEWEHMGVLLAAGTRLKSFTMSGRSNNNNLNTLEVYGLLKTPNPITRFETGFDADGEVTITDIFRGDFETSGIHTLSGNMNDIRRQRWEFDFTTPTECYLSLYFKPTVNGNTTRYFQCTHFWETEL